MTEKNCCGIILAILIEGGIFVEINLKDNLTIQVRLMRDKELLENYELDVAEEIGKAYAEDKFKNSSLSSDKKAIVMKKWKDNHFSEHLELARRAIDAYYCPEECVDVEAVREIIEETEAQEKTKEQEVIVQGVDSFDDSFELFDFEETEIDFSCLPATTTNSTNLFADTETIGKFIKSLKKLNPGFVCKMAPVIGADVNRNQYFYIQSDVNVSELLLPEGYKLVEENGNLMFENEEKKVSFIGVPRIKVKKPEKMNKLALPTGQITTMASSLLEKAKEKVQGKNQLLKKELAAQTASYNNLGDEYERKYREWDEKEADYQRALQEIGRQALEKIQEEKAAAEKKLRAKEAEIAKEKEQIEAKKLDVEKKLKEKQAEIEQQTINAVNATLKGIAKYGSLKAYEKEVAKYGSREALEFAEKVKDKIAEEKTKEKNAKDTISSPLQVFYTKEILQKAYEDIINSMSLENVSLDFEQMLKTYEDIIASVKYGDSEFAKAVSMRLAQNMSVEKSFYTYDSTDIDYSPIILENGSARLYEGTLKRFLHLKYCLMHQKSATYENGELVLDDRASKFCSDEILDAELEGDILKIGEEDVNEQKQPIYLLIANYYQNLQRIAEAYCDFLDVRKETSMSLAKELSALYEEERLEILAANRKRQEESAKLVQHRQDMLDNFCCEVLGSEYQKRKIK